MGCWTYASGLAWMPCGSVRSDIPANSCTGSPMAIRGVDPKVQINHLLDYLRVTPHLIPQAEQLNLHPIRHPDLSPPNIFIADPGDINGIIVLATYYHPSNCLTSQNLQAISDYGLISRSGAQNLKRIFLP
jgi:hypothetical protein